jgi:hypothetical protein
MSVEISMKENFEKVGQENLVRSTTIHGIMLNLLWQKKTERYVF